MNTRPQLPKSGGSEIMKSALHDILSFNHGQTMIIRKYHDVYRINLITSSISLFQRPETNDYVAS